MSDYDPTPEQEAILGYEPGRHARILAGPGTGKSATLVALIERLLEGNDSPRVRLLTFTRAATGELAKKVADHPAAAAERPSTIHSFSISVLLRNPGTGAFPEPLRIADPWEYSNLVRLSLAARAGVRVRDLDRLVREMAAAWESLEPPEEDPRVAAEDRARFMGAWQEHRSVYGYTLLAELPYALRQALLDHPDLDGVDYDLLIVDEYQDLNACDLAVLHLLADRGCWLIGAGDDDQSIYSFRKAAPEGIRRFPDDYAGAGDYTLSVSQRCGERILAWANFVISGDPDRPPKPALTPGDEAPEGEVALLAFDGHVAEARGIAALARRLIDDEGLNPSDILILVRTDYNQHFSRLIERELTQVGVPASDPERVGRMLGEESNRRLLASFRLLVNRQDSLAWATLLRLTHGVGDAFVDHVYDRARNSRTQFGTALLVERTRDFAGAPSVASRIACDLVDRMTAWIERTDMPEDGVAWGTWIVDNAGADVPGPSDELADLLRALDETAEPDQGLGRYLGQIWPLGQDYALAESAGVRIMTMGGSKGLTVRATIAAALEDEVVPRLEPPLDEERRLLYVALTRAREFLYGTWARRRTGPTARVGGGASVTRRSLTRFLRDGPVVSEDGNAFIARR